MLKKYVSIAVFVVITLTSTIMLNAKTDKATTLNQLKVLKGTGTDYNLDGQLKRSEAAAFIVRLLGVEDEVMKNKTEYVKTGFADIKETDWYAMYVGYVAKNGIVGGYGNGNYGPSDNVTEKQFTKMVLGALGHTQGADFEWSEVYKYAYAQGLYTDIEYKTKTNDTNKYTRGSVVDILHNALTLKIKDTNETAIRRMIRTGFIKKELAVSLKLIKEDKITTNIDTIKATDKNTIEIDLNEAIIDSKELKITIQTTNTDEKLKIKEVAYDKNKLIVTTDTQTLEANYEIQIDNLVDEAGNITNNVTMEFKGYSLEKVESDFFRIASVKALNRSQIEVTYTHPITYNATLQLNYTIYKGEKEFVKGSFDTMKAHYFEGNDKRVVLDIKNKQLESGIMYKLVVSGNLESKYTTPLNDGDGDEMVFIGSSDVVDDIQIVSVTALDDAIIRVRFSQPYDSSNITETSSYELTGDSLSFSRRAVAVVETGYGEYKDRQIDIHFISNSMKDGKIYELKTKKVVDYFGRSEIKDKTTDLIGVSEEASKVKLEFVAAFSQSHLVAYFTEALDSTSKAATMSLGGVTKDSVRIDNNLPNMMHIYLDSSTTLEAGKSYDISFFSGINYITNIAQTDILEYKITGNGNKADNISITEAKFVAKNTVLVTFNDDVHTSSNDISSKYELVYTKDDKEKSITAESANVIDPRTMILKFNDTEPSISYSLEASNIQDYTGQFTTSQASSSLSR